MIDGLLTVNDLANRAVDLFHWPEEDNGAYTSKANGRVRNKLIRTAEKMKDEKGESIYDRAKARAGEHKEGNAKAFFTEDEAEEILYSESVYNFMTRKHETGMPSWEELNIRRKAEIAEWNEYVREHPDSARNFPPMEFDDDSVVMKTMVLALYELFFYPIDEKLIRRDYYKSLLEQGNSVKLSTYASRERQEDLRNYIVPKVDAANFKDPSDAILDNFAGRIADKVSPRVMAEIKRLLSTQGNARTSKARK